VGRVVEAKVPWHPARTTSVANDSSGATRPGNLIVFVWLMGASIVATAAIAPALLFLFDPARPSLFADESVAPVPLVTSFAVANILVSGVAIAIGLRLEPKVGMGVPLLRSWLAGDRAASRQILAMVRRSFVLGFGLAAMVLAGGLAFRSQLPALPDNFVFPPVWQGLLMMLGAAVREEILFRLFALNLFVWMVMKVLRRQEPTTTMVWTTNVLVALVFAGMHLLPAAQLLDLNALARGLVIAVATGGGVVLGWVYWRYGLLMAMFTHASGGLLVYLGVRGLMAWAA
jgi:membrane protease YdiL (CAAX protease family)